MAATAWLTPPGCTWHSRPVSCLCHPTPRPPAGYFESAFLKTTQTKSTPVDIDSLGEALVRYRALKRAEASRAEPKVEAKETS